MCLFVFKFYIAHYCILFCVCSQLDEDSVSLMGNFLVRLIHVHILQEVIRLYNYVFSDLNQWLVVLTAKKCKYVMYHIHGSYITQAIT
jgi:hypothetical protein